MEPTPLELIQEALDVIEDLAPELYPNENTRDMWIYITCERLRRALALSGEAHPLDLEVD